MKILIITNGFPPEKKGGTEIYSKTISAGLKDRGHQVSVIAFTEETVSSVEPVFEDGLEIYKIGKTVGRFNPLNRFRRSYLDRKIDEKISGIINRVNPDIIHVQHLIKLSSGFLKKLNIPHLITLNDFWFICPLIQLMRADGKLCDTSNADDCMNCIKLRYNLGLTANILNAFGIKEILNRNKYLLGILNKSNILISPSNFLIEMYRKNGVTNPNLILLRYGIDTERFKEKPKQKNKNLKIGFIGSFMKHKGPELLINAFKNLRKIHGNIELHLYGYNGGDDSYFKKYARTEENGKIFFHGPVDNKEVPGVLSSLDLLVIPSRWYENSPIIIYESYLSKTPFITSDIGGMKELAMATGMGVTFKNEDAIDLAEKINDYLEGKINRNYKPEFLNEIDLNKHLESLEKIYERII